MGYKKDAIVNWDCEGNPSEPAGSSVKWYWIHFVQYAQTTDCETIKTSDPSSKPAKSFHSIPVGNDCTDIKLSSGPDGYYTARIRGYEVEVYCRMSETPAQTFVDVEATATQGGDQVVSGQLPTTIAIQKALVEYNQCMIRVNRMDASFYTATLTGDFSASPPHHSLSKILPL